MAPYQELLRKVFLVLIYVFAVVSFIFFVLGEAKVIDDITQNIMFIAMGLIFITLGCYQLFIHQKHERFYKSAVLMFAFGVGFIVCYIILLFM